MSCTKTVACALCVRDIAIVSGSSSGGCLGLHISGVDNCKDSWVYEI